jgi:hypothetical protein
VSAIGLVIDDGGRAEAGYKGQTGDCVARAIAIATDLSYQEAYNLLNATASDDLDGDRSNARTGVQKSITRAVMQRLGFNWTPTMSIGSGCTIHLRADELPGGVVVVKLSKHVATVIDGVLHDTYDCSRDGTRCVYGYWRKS